MGAAQCGLHASTAIQPPHSQPPPLQPPLTLYCAAVTDLPQAPSSTIINQTGGREPDRRVGVECTTGRGGGGHLQWGGSRSSVRVKEFLSLWCSWWSVWLMIIQRSISLLWKPAVCFHMKSANETHKVIHWISDSADYQMSSWSLIINNRGFLYFNQHKSNRKEAANSCSHGLRSEVDPEPAAGPGTRHTQWVSVWVWSVMEAGGAPPPRLALSAERFVGSCSDPCAHWPSQLQMFADVLEDRRTSENVFHSSTQTSCMSEMKNHTLLFYGCHGNTLSDPGNK